MGLKEHIKETPLFEQYLKKRRVIKWIKEGYKSELHYIKQMTILYYAVTYKLGVLVETGTFLGDMIWAQKDYFEKLYSIELSKELFEKAKRRFKYIKHVQLLNGDSSDKLKTVVDQLTGPAVFWLDGHYSGGITARGELSCPVYAELSHIFKSSFSHVILIDDARLFNGKDDYPTIEELKLFIGKSNCNYNSKIENDIIIITRSC